jgi:hypothetical protein
MPTAEPQSKRLVWPWPIHGRAPLLADWLRLIGHLASSSAGRI